MRGRQIKRLIVTIVVCLCCLSAFASGLSRIISIQIQPAPDKSRFIITMNKRTAVDVKYQSDPDRVILTFADATKNFNMKNARLGGSNVEVIDVANTTQGAVEFVFKTRGKATWKTEYLNDDAAGNAVFQLEVITPLLKK